MMWNSTSNLFALVGRILVAFLFIPAGFGKLMGFSGAVGYAASAGMPLPTLAVALGLAIELLGGLALLLGWGTRWAALILAFFTLVASFFFHAYWGLPADQAATMQLLFNKNVAVVGGLLAFAAFGAGGFSVDAHNNKL